MATQVDSFGRGGSFKSFRPWRHRDQTTTGHPTGQETTHDSVQETHGDGSTDVRQVPDIDIAHAVKNEPPSTSHTENHRPRSPYLASPPSHPHSQRISASHPVQNDIIADASAAPPSASSTADDDLIPRTPGPSIVLPQDRTSPPLQSATQPHTSPPPPTPLPQQTPRPSLKRRRALSDVDGPNTAALCCKKRRLRRFLITSRLSQPFSQPATHILNRESVAAGDKRFLKLAAIMNARRITTHTKPPTAHPPIASEVLRRAAMANRLRRRIYAEATVASSAGRPLTGIPLSLMANMANARFTIVPVATAASIAGRVPAMTTTTTPTTTAAEVASSAVFTAVVPGSTGITVGGGTRLAWKPAAGLMKSPPLSPHRPIVRAVSRSPKLRPVKDATVVPRLQATPENRRDRDDAEPACYDGDNDDSDCAFAFPTSEHETDGNDDTEDVYADFSVLFSSATAGDELDDGVDGLDGLDDYMDELDGIAHLPR